MSSVVRQGLPILGTHEGNFMGLSTRAFACTRKSIRQLPNGLPLAFQVLSAWSFLMAGDSLR
jgi:hypothetical protein